MPLPSNNKQVGDLGHADDHNSIINEITSLIAASVNYLGVSASSKFLFISSSPSLSNSIISTIVNSAPATLDTLNELASALGNDPNFATSTASAIGQRLLASTASTLYLGIGNTANHARTASSITGSLVTGTVTNATRASHSNTASSIAGFLVTGPVASANFALFANSASSIDWSLVTSRPSASPALNPQIGINLVGSIIGAASATLTQLGNAQITITTSGGTGGGGSSSVDWINVNNKPDPVIGVNLVGSITGAASATLTDLTNAQITINTSGGGSGTASAVDWSNVTNKPNPQIGVSLTGPVTGNASAVFNSLSNAQVTITTQQNITINPQTVSSYTLQLSDVSKLITMNNASENAIVIPLESSVNFPIGSQIDIVQIGSGTSSVTFVNGVTLNSDTSKKTINARYAAASLVKLGSDSWLLIGALK